MPLAIAPVYVLTGLAVSVACDTSFHKRQQLGRWQKDRSQRQNLTNCQSANRMHSMASQRLLMGVGSGRESLLRLTTE